MARTSREGGVVIGRFPKTEGSIGFLMEQRVKHWAELCHRSENSSVRPHLVWMQA